MPYRFVFHMEADPSRTKKLDLLSALGAGVLGAGLALLFEDWLRPFALPAILIGALAHGWAMLAKHRLEKTVRIVQPAWTIFAYWSCWILLLALMLYIGVQLFP